MTHTAYVARKEDARAAYVHAPVHARVCARICPPSLGQVEGLRQGRACSPSFDRWEGLRIDERGLAPYAAITFAYLGSLGSSRWTSRFAKSTRRSFPLEGNGSYLLVQRIRLLLRL